MHTAAYSTIMPISASIVKWKQKNKT